MPEYVDTRGTGVELWYYHHDPFDGSSTRVVRNPDNRTNLIVPLREEFAQVFGSVRLDLSPIEEFYRNPNTVRKAEVTAISGAEATIVAYALRKGRGMKVIRGPIDPLSKYRLDAHDRFIRGLESVLGFAIEEKEIDACKLWRSFGRPKK